MIFPIEEYQRLCDVLYLRRDTQSLAQLQRLGLNLWIGFLEYQE